MAKLGYTFYPKDWSSSESVFELDLAERGFFRELIDLAMTNDNKTEIKKDVWSRKFCVSVKNLEKIMAKLLTLNLIEIKDNILFVPSCESRLIYVRTGSIGGKQGNNTKGLGKGNAKGIDKGLGKQREREREREEESEIGLPNTHLENDIRFLSIDECRQTYDTYHGAKKETICMAKRLSMEQLAKLQDEFDKGLKTKESSKLVTDYVTHFANWANKEYAQNFIIELKKPQSTNDRAKYKHLGF